jgi:hypothetical protein
MIIAYPGVGVRPTSERDPAGTGSTNASDGVCPEAVTAPTGIVRAGPTTRDGALLESEIDPIVGKAVVFCDGVGACPVRPSEPAASMSPNSKPGALVATANAPSVGTTFASTSTPMASQLIEVVHVAVELVSNVPSLRNCVSNAVAGVLKFPSAAGETDSVHPDRGVVASFARCKKQEICALLSRDFAA